MINPLEFEKMRAESPDEFNTLIAAIKVYTANRDSPEPNDLVEKTSLTPIKLILDKHEIPYRDDL